MASCTYQFGEWLVEPDLNRISRGSVQRHLEPLSMTALVYFLEHADRTISPDTLLDAVWPQRVVEANAVPRVINEIRRALDDDYRCPAYIQTVRKRGYRVVGTVDRRLQSPPRAATAASERSAANNLLEQAHYEFHRTWDPREPLRLAREAARLDSSSVHAHTQVASYLTLLAEGNQLLPRDTFALAKKSAMDAVALDPHWGNTHVLLGFISDRLDLDLRTAMRSYEKAASLGSRRDMLGAYLQSTLMAAGSYEQGLDVCLEAGRLQPGLGTYQAYTGRFLFRLHRYDEALESYGKALQLSPDNWVVVYDAIRHMIRMNELDRAEIVADRYMLSNPAFEQSDLKQEVLGRLALARGDDGPLREWAAAAETRRNLVYVSAMRISNAYYRLGDYGRHMDWFRTQYDERDHVGIFVDDLRRWKDYWVRLDQWAVANPDDAPERPRRLTDHRALVQRVVAGFTA